jgi:hypothetical protein
MNSNSLGIWVFKYEAQEKDRCNLLNMSRKERIRRSERESTTSIPFYHKMAEYKQSQLYFFPDARANLSVGNLTHTQFHSFILVTLSLSLSELSFTLSISLFGLVSQLLQAHALCIPLT